MAAEICAKFVSKKICSVRWRPRDGSTNSNPEFFVTGSWDDQENEITLWRCPSDYEGGEPYVVSTLSATGDVRDLNFCGSSTLVAAVGDGSVSLLRIQGRRMEAALRWSLVHRCGERAVACTATAVTSQEIASVGEDGKLNLMRTIHDKPYKTIDADSCTLNAATFTSQTEILTGNSRGTVKVWDLRSTSDRPVQSSCIAEDAEIGVSSMDRHPFQGHVVAVGSYDGALVIYDMRKAEVPVTVLAGPESCLTRVRFHPDRSDHLLTSTECGGLWSWSPLAATAAAPAAQGSVWLNGHLTAGQLDIKEVLPPLPLAVNSVDVSGERLVCGGDNEAFYYLPRLPLS